MTGGFAGHRQSARDAERAQRGTVRAGHGAGGHESEVQHAPRRFQRMERARVDFPQHRIPGGMRLQDERVRRVVDQPALSGHSRPISPAT